MPFLQMPERLTNNPNAAALGAYGQKIVTNGTATGLFYAMRTVTEVTISAWTVNTDNITGTLVGVVIPANSTILLFSATSVTITGTAQFFNVPG